MEECHSEDTHQDCLYKRFPKLSICLNLGAEYTVQKYRLDLAEGGMLIAFYYWQEGGL